MILYAHALHHIYIFTMFHAFRCVVYKLKPCVLVGLNWAKPMMFLLLHVTCSCIRTILFLLFDIIFYQYIFACLSLSLSLFLLNSLRMAPKCKCAPSRNPLRSGASSSSDPTPCHVRFRDDKARQDFSENFSKCSIHSKCQVILSDFSDTDLPTVINSQGQESFYDILINCPSVIIQEFYSNMYGFDYSIPLFLTSI